MVEVSTLVNDKITIYIYIYYSRHISFIYRNLNNIYITENTTQEIMATINVDLSVDEWKHIQLQREVKEQVITITRQKKLLETYESEIHFFKDHNEKLSTECQKRTRRWYLNKKRDNEYIKHINKLVRTIINCWHDGCKTKQQIKNLDDTIIKCQVLVVENEHLEEWNGNMK